MNQRDDMGDFESINQPWGTCSKTQSDNISAELLLQGTHHTNSSSISQYKSRLHTWCLGKIKDLSCCWVHKWVLTVLLPINFLGCHLFNGFLGYMHLEHLCYNFRGFLLQEQTWSGQMDGQAIRLHMVNNVASKGTLEIFIRHTCKLPK